MIIVFHINNRITAVFTSDYQKIEFDGNDTIALGIQKLALLFPDKKIVWCSSIFKEKLNLPVINTIFHHDKMMLSYLREPNNFFDSKMGYVEESPFINVNKKVAHPTWQMSSVTGVIHASLLIAIKDKIRLDSDFDYYLNSVAKICMPLGLICYSEPKLLNEGGLVHSPKASIYMLFRFVKQHYKTRWVFLLLLNLVLYERKFPLLPFLFSLFYKNRGNSNINLESIAVQSSRKVIDKATVDVIIPTIGRKKYLYDILTDLKSQTHLPSHVIIVEQNPDEKSKSELDYLTNEIWPFTIKHTFIHQSGACNARNIALGQVKGEWVFFADDDIRIEPNFIQKTLEKINKFGIKGVSMKCFQKENFQKETVIFQWITFGAGSSFVFAESLKNCKFFMGYEFGFGEDGDFGMQLRHQGCDVLYLPDPKILHLKAPIGGFRTKPVLKWQKEGIQPKPSPTVMLYQILHNTPEQLFGYKTILFFKFYKHQKIKNPVGYFLNFRRQWKQSLFWANELKNTQ